MINPGFIEPQAFYNTTNDAQSKFFWGGHGPQFGTNQFDAKAYNQVAAPNTPYGAQSVTGSLSPEDYDAIIAGNYRAPQVTPATRAEAYQPSPYQPYQYGQVRVGLDLPSQIGSNTTNPNNPANVDYTNNGQYNLVAGVLGPDLARQQQEAIARGDNETAQRIQSQYEYAMQDLNRA
jgi:hypothetical protein